MKRVLILLLVLLSMMSLMAKTYKIVYEEYPPYEFKSGGKLTGLDVDILNAIATKNNINFDFVEVPWERALHMVQIGEADGIISLFATDERKAFLNFPSEGLAYEKNVIFARKSFKGDIKNINEMKENLIGVTSGYSYGKTFDNAKNIKKDVSKDQETMVKKFINKRFDLFITNELVGHHMLKSQNFSDYKTLSYVADNQMLYIGISKKSANSKELFDIVNKSLNEMKASGELNKIRAKYIK